MIKPGPSPNKTEKIRNIIKEYKWALETEIFPNRIDENGDYEVPKTV
ncbi:MAG: hypothetical protein U9Q98_08790 [Bacteroidota bacterium]|nr:hypothetical protein [Bacteroidota bacterium]